MEGNRKSQPRKTMKLEDVPKYEALVDAVKRAYNDVERGKYRLRDLALVATLTFTGCRLGEALKLKLKDLDFKEKTVKIRQEKKREEFIRVVPVPSRLYWDIMERYARRIPHKESRLFELSDRQVRNVIYKFSLRYLKLCLRPHSIRHSYALFVLKTTKDLEVVRRLLGHSDYKWLRVYLNYTQEDLADELSKAFEALED